VEGVRPTRIDAPIAIYRLHSGSKSVADPSGFVAESKRVRAEYELLLTPAERLRLRLSRRHRRAWRRGVRAVALLQEGRRGAAAREAASAVVHWPPIVVSRGVVLAAKELSGRGEPAAESPIDWPDWD